MYTHTNLNINVHTPANLNINVHTPANLNINVHTLANAMGDAKTSHRKGQGQSRVRV